MITNTVMGIPKIGAQAKQAGKLTKKSERKICYFIFWRKVQLVKSCTSYISEHVMQITHYHVGVQKHHTSYSWSAQHACKSWEFIPTRVLKETGSSARDLV